VCPKFSRLVVSWSEKNRKDSHSARLAKILTLRGYMNYLAEFSHSLGRSRTSGSNPAGLSDYHPENLASTVWRNLFRRSGVVWSMS